MNALNVEEIASSHPRIVILGNSGSGKSTPAKWFAKQSALAYLDLDTVAWEANQIAVARDTALAVADVKTFCTTHARWVVEGCYAHLAEATFDSISKSIRYVVAPPCRAFALSASSRLVSY